MGEPGVSNYLIVVLVIFQAAQGHFTTEALMRNQNEKERTYSGRTVSDFDKALVDLMAEDPKLKSMINKAKMPEGYLEVGVSNQ